MKRGLTHGEGQTWLFLISWLWCYYINHQANNEREGKGGSIQKTHKLFLCYVHPPLEWCLHIMIILNFEVSCNLFTWRNVWFHLVLHNIRHIYILVWHLQRMQYLLWLEVILCVCIFFVYSINNRQRFGLNLTEPQNRGLMV